MPSPEEMEAAMIANLEAKTGRTLPQWLKVTRASRLDKHGAIVKLLEAEHGVGHGYANLIAQRTLAERAPAPAGGDFVAAQYGGVKAGMKPVYDRVVKAASALGSDVQVRPLKSYVTLRRTKQFAIVKASTRTRVDLGLNLRGVEPAGRLLPSGSLGSMCTHRVELGGPADVDAEVKRWLKAAYDGA